MNTRVGVFGAGGRMGATVCQALADDPELILAAGIDPVHEGERIAGIEISGDRSALEAAEVDVVVDFTHVDAARGNLAYVAEQGMHAVVGTTGFSDDDLDRVREQFTTSNCVIAPNFAVSAVVMMRLAEMAAPFFDSVEIIELHHDRKIDAPSGTAMMTAARIAAAADHWARDATENEVVAGARGGRGPGDIAMHAVRLRGLVAHQEVLFGTTGQSLTIRQDSYDRSSFMPGVVLAVKRIADHPGVTIGLDPLLGL